MIEEFHCAVDTSHGGIPFPLKLNTNGPEAPERGSFGVLRCQERVVLFRGAIVTCRRPSPRPKPWAPGDAKNGGSSAAWQARTGPPVAENAAISSPKSKPEMNGGLREGSAAKP